MRAKIVGQSKHHKGNLVLLVSYVSFGVVYTSRQQVRKQVVSCMDKVNPTPRSSLGPVQPRTLLAPTEESL